jgi:hypothetical protein
VLSKLEREARRRVGPLGRLRGQVEARARLEQQEGLFAVVSRAAELEEDSLLVVVVVVVVVVGGGGWAEGQRGKGVVREGKRRRQRKDKARDREIESFRLHL